MLVITQFSNLFKIPIFGIELVLFCVIGLGLVAVPKSASQT